MTALEFSTELQALFARAFNEGIVPGKLSSAEAVGLMELNKTQFIGNVNAAIAAATARQRPPLILPRRPPLTTGLG